MAGYPISLYIRKAISEGVRCEPGAFGVNPVDVWVHIYCHGYGRIMQLTHKVAVVYRYI